MTKKKTIDEGVVGTRKCRCGGLMKVKECGGRLLKFIAQCEVCGSWYDCRKAK